MYNRDNITGLLVYHTVDDSYSWEIRGVNGNDVTIEIFNVPTYRLHQIPYKAGEVMVRHIDYVLELLNTGRWGVL